MNDSGNVSAQAGAKFLKSHMRNTGEKFMDKLHNNHDSNYRDRNVGNDRKQNHVQKAKPGASAQDIFFGFFVNQGTIPSLFRYQSNRYIRLIEMGRDEDIRKVN